MNTEVRKCGSEDIQSFRELFLNEHAFQFVHNKCHDYGWSDDWLINVDGVEVGYGCVWGSNNRKERDTIFEYYIIPQYRKLASVIFALFKTHCNVPLIECQTNDPLLSRMVFEFAENINTEAVLFEEDHNTFLKADDIVFRKVQDDDKMDNDDNSPYVLDYKGEIIASGGLMLNYNFPYADIYMQVKEPYRRKGYGSFLVQKLKKEAYLQGRAPAARCNVNNHISKATLQKAGLRVCGYLLNAKLKS
ncbi:MAG: GNAT family N-acetyltransferase [Chitinophagaceae bacterium]|nr:GNAT family N-acetyltransferase [Chitinophagaceae bacterium]